MTLRVHVILSHVILNHITLVRAPRMARRPPPRPVRVPLCQACLNVGAHGSYGMEVSEEESDGEEKRATGEAHPESDQFHDNETLRHDAARRPHKLNRRAERAAWKTELNIVLHSEARGAAAELQMYKTKHQHTKREKPHSQRGKLVHPRMKYTGRRRDTGWVRDTGWCRDTGCRRDTGW